MQPSKYSTRAQRFLDAISHLKTSRTLRSPECQCKEDFTFCIEEFGRCGTTVLTLAGCVVDQGLNTNIDPVTH
jgi:hypothetical protein